MYLLVGMIEVVYSVEDAKNIASLQPYRVRE